MSKRRNPPPPSSPAAQNDKIDSMNIFTILVAIALGAVVVVLIVGVFAMARGGAFNTRYGNRMMRGRVALQALAVILMLVCVFAASRGN